MKRCHKSYSKKSHFSRYFRLFIGVFVIFYYSTSIVIASGGYDNGTATGKGKLGLDLTWNPFNYFPDGQSYIVASYGFSEKFDMPHVASQTPTSLIALDWWNGSRELQKSDLTGLILGLTLDTKPEEIYRALIESAAFGTKRIMESYEKAGIPIHEIRASGGMPDQNQLVMQVFADVLGRTIKVAKTSQGSALGSAMLAAMALGVPTQNMGGLGDRAYVPNNRNTKRYDEVYEIYLTVYRQFSDGVLMAHLNELKEVK